MLDGSFAGSDCLACTLFQSLKRHSLTHLVAVVRIGRKLITKTHHLRLTLAFQFAMSPFYLVLFGAQLASLCLFPLMFLARFAVFFELLCPLLDLLETESCLLPRKPSEGCACLRMEAGASKN